MLDLVSKSTAYPQAAPISSNFLLLTLAEISPGKPIYSRLAYSRAIKATHSDQSGYKCAFIANYRVIFQLEKYLTSSICLHRRHYSFLSPEGSKYRHMAVISKAYQSFCVY